MSLLDSSRVTRTTPAHTDLTYWCMLWDVFRRMCFRRVRKAGCRTHCVSDPRHSLRFEDGLPLLGCPMKTFQPRIAIQPYMTKNSDDLRVLIKKNNNKMHVFEKVGDRNGITLFNKTIFILRLMISCQTFSGPSHQGVLLLKLHDHSQKTFISGTQRK